MDKPCWSMVSDADFHYARDSYITYIQQVKTLKMRFNRTTPFNKQPPNFAPCSNVLPMG